MKDVKKKIDRIFVICFFLILAVPFVSLLWYEEKEVTENKTLAEFPSVRTERGINFCFLSELSDYFQDHFGYRQELVTANNLLKAKVFGVSGEDLAVVGKDGWLFLSASLDSFWRNSKLSERGLNNVIRTLSLMQEYVTGMGKQFVFTVAPNKNTLYPQYMPYYCKAGDAPSDLERFCAAVEQTDINYVNLVPLFSESEEILYHRGDSHWDNRGAAMVQNALLERLELPHRNYAEYPAKPYDTFEGDIDKILYPLKRHREVEYSYDEYMDYSYLGTDDVTAVTVLTQKEDAAGRLLCIRDSFGNSLLPFLANEFSYGEFSKQVPYRIDRMYSENMDVCIVELVERNLNLLCQYAPVLPAPLRSVEREEVTQDALDDAHIKCQRFDGYYKIYGELSEDVVAVDGRIYVELSGESGSFTVEAFPANELMSETENQDYGFVAYINEGALPAGTYGIFVLSEDDGLRLFTTDLTVDF